MQSVQLKVNEEKLVKHLRLSFSNATTVLGELMQNARRAHATQVAFDYDEAAGRLSVTDDGCGIADMQMLVSIADSGWDAETLRTEHPFGMGFLAAVYAAEHLTVESRGARIDCDTERLLAFEPVRVEPCEGRRRHAHHPARGTHRGACGCAQAPGVWLPDPCAAQR